MIPPLKYTEFKPSFAKKNEATPSSKTQQDPNDQVTSLQNLVNQEFELLKQTIREQELYIEQLKKTNEQQRRKIQQLEGSKYNPQIQDIGMDSLQIESSPE